MSKNVNEVYMSEVRICEKYALTVEEAALYFQIGINKLRTIIANNRSADYLLQNGTKTLFKRVKFEQWLDKTAAI